ncbi:MAG TPA: type II toxin-antitoxin system VapC family toxin [Hanamia sp.]
MEQKYLIDTNVLIAAQMNSLPEASRKFIAEIIDKDFTISFITYIEFLGYKNATKETEDFIALANVLEINKEIIQRCIKVRKSNVVKLPDAIIAATALVNDLTLTTRNMSDFKNIPGLKIINPWEL